MKTNDPLSPVDDFAARHIGPRDADISEMLASVGCDSLDALADDTIPANIRLDKPLYLPDGIGEYEALAELRGIASRNQVCRSFIGVGYYNTITPPVIRRNILENPGWYTQYTPYQAEISQGRLEALLNFQTMIADLSGLPLANASLLDEATAAAEAMTMCRRISKVKGDTFFVAGDCHPQTIAVVRTRARPLGIRLEIGDPNEFDFEQGGAFGVLLQYPATDGRIRDYSGVVDKAHAAGALAVMATDLLALTLIKPPGEFAADIAVGSAQRFGVPLGAGGPHAAFMATSEKHARQMPGRIVGVSKDARGNPAYRLAIQTREQHIRRDRATSNICTAQVLLAIMASMYAIYHGPDRLRRIARRVHTLATLFERGLERLGLRIGTETFFDTVRVRLASNQLDAVRSRAADAGINLRYFDNGDVGVSLDETTCPADIEQLWSVISGQHPVPFGVDDDILADTTACDFGPLGRTSTFLTHAVFNSYHAEHEMLRYIKRLESRDLSLTTSMIPLGSCTMKLNAAAEMLPITWPEFAEIHPFAPQEQTSGYARLFEQLEAWIAEMTGFHAVSLQPNAGAQGEYSGLLAIRAYHASRGEAGRDVCLIPTSAHGTNPASAVLAGCRVVTVACDALGNVDVDDLREKAAQHRDQLAALMITYPSTHGVFEPQVREVCEIVHAAGGQVYMDGANLNAQLGLTRPADIGADVCHLNLHKTFCIPHGGGGPGVGPIACTTALAPFLPAVPQQKSQPGAAVPQVDPMWHSRPRLCSSAQPPSAGNDVAQSPSAGNDVAQSPSAGNDVAQSPSAGNSAQLPDASPVNPKYRRNLPHINPDLRPVFVTFRTYKQWILPDQIRARILEHCRHDHGSKIELYAAVVMPDHVHMIFTPLLDDSGNPYGLAEIMGGVKGASAHSVNKMLGRKGSVWQDESFDHILRSNESLEEKVEYVCQNPVRKGIVESPDEYPWLWRPWLEESPEKSQPGAAVPHVGPVSAAPYGSAGILPISWMYIRMMGAAGLRRATQIAILNANYMAKRLEGHYDLVYQGVTGRVAHEFIIDLRPFKKSAGIEPDDVAKRLMDFGFHAPTMSFPVVGTLMIEPTESESRGELDRLCDALIAIRAEIRTIEEGAADRADNPLKNAPHTAAAVCAGEWPHPYPREQAAYPAPWTRLHKFWPAVARIDNVYGDRHLCCTCG